EKYLLNRLSKPFERLAPILLVLLFLSPFAVAQAGSQSDFGPLAVPAQSQKQDSLSREDREEIFEDVWETVNEKYYDPRFNGVDWRGVRDRYRLRIYDAKSDDEFYLLIKQMVGELNDAHTRFHTPRERREREQLQATSTGISIFEVEQRPVVVGVDPTSEAARAGVEAGMIVLAIDGVPVESKVADARRQVAGTSSERAVLLRVYRRILDGESGTTVNLTLQRKNSTRFDVKVTRHVVSDGPTVKWRLLDSGYGYIRLNIWKSPIHKEFKKALEQLKNTPGLVIDLRGNPGGEAGEVVKIASYFFSRKVSFGRFLARSGKSIELFTDDDDQVYRSPVVILINEASGSGSELFAACMQENNRAIVVGRQSCGCVLGIAKFRKVEGGGELAVSELGYLSARGRRLEGSGVIPDETIALRIVDLQSNRDRTIEEAEGVLRNSVRVTRGAN
ncbi:MAG TPA: S41 family peptidase, partial [Blastocatellia bacterium]|nr:S41 family peptidase [Blastocatellia bacterium]